METARKEKPHDTKCREINSQVREEISKIYLNLKSGKYTDAQKEKLRHGLAELERQLRGEKESIENGK